MRVLICGDRNWVRGGVILAAFDRFNKKYGINLVIQGGAKGADRLGQRVADVYKIPVEEYKAKWDKYGRAAGIIRNQEMLSNGKPDLVLAFHDDLFGVSKGTKDMVHRAHRNKIPVRAYNSKGVLIYCDREIGGIDAECSLRVEGRTHDKEEGTIACEEK